MDYLEYKVAEIEISTEKALSTESDVDNDPLQGLLNDTDSELSSLSHLDAPSESVYMICGVLIAMILVGVIIVLLATIIRVVSLVSGLEERRRLLHEHNKQLCSFHEAALIKSITRGDETLAVKKPTTRFQPGNQADMDIGRGSLRFRLF